MNADYTWTKDDKTIPLERRDVELFASIDKIMPGARCVRVERLTGNN